jgi:hypothetical protein
MKKIILVVLIFFISSETRATHLMGGEITWECIKTGSKSGQYVFTVKVYRDCQGVTLGNFTLQTHNIPGMSSIPLTSYEINDLSPSCNTVDGPNSQFSCGGTNIYGGGNGNGAVEEHVYMSDTIRILGAPDANGWHFTWSSCCRNNAITNISNPGGQGFTLRAVMYSYTDSLGVSYPNNDDCYDSSPKFYEKPRTILEVNNGYDPSSLTNGFTYSHNAFDEEQDSIVYDWGIPINDYYDYLNPNSSAIPFLSPYSYTSPINGITLNSITGRTSYPADLQGNYVTCTKVDAYKCGQIVAEIYREIQIVLIPPTCNIGLSGTDCNVRPSVVPPFYYVGTPNPYQWDTLVHCGDTVTFDFIANDNDYYPNGSQQNLLFEVSGGQFYNYNDGVPCQNPPCATFEESITGANPPFTTANGTGTGQFEWITSCNHVINNCSGYSPSVYTFVVRVTDDFCPAPAIENTAQVISITVYPPCDLKGNLVVNQPNCGLNDGQVIFNPSGGVPPYNTYIFDMNGIPVNRDSLFPGSYQIRITDSTLCETVDTVVLSSPNQLFNTITTSDPSCNGFLDGNINIQTTGGTAPYTYLWSNGDTNQILQNIGAGQYLLTVTDSNNCVKLDSISLSEPALITYSPNVIDALCYGDNNGSISVNVFGGTLPYFYNWSTGDSTSSINNLSAGNYILSVIDSNNCLMIDSFSVMEPSLLTNSISGSNPTCFGFTNGNINNLTTGGVLSYNYLWSNGDTTQNLQNIGAGQYSVIINDSNNCLFYDSIILSDPSALLVIDSATNVSCFGSTNASVTFNLSGGTPSYIISAFGQTFPIPYPTSVTIPTIVPIPAGVYPYSITDFQGCVIQDTLTITQPNPLTNSPTIGYVSCSGFNNGSITLNPIGGTGPYTYLWNTGDTTQFLVNIPSGQYFVSILDSNNCLAIDTILMIQPNQLDDSSSTIMPTCNGFSDGSINIVASGGTMPYNYFWSTGDTSQNLQNVSAGQYIVSVIDSNSCILYDTIVLLEPNAISAIDSIENVSCNGLSDGSIFLLIDGGTGSYDMIWETGDTISSITNLISDWYEISITDSNNCLLVDSFFVEEPTILEDSITITEPTCYSFSNGSTTVFPFGSVAPYTYLWSNGDTSQFLQNISAGMYTVVITDYNNCTLYDTLNISDPSILSYNELTDSVSCFGYNDGSIDLTINGGIPPYTYLWNTGDTLEDISNLIAGTYVVNVLDSNDCLLIANIDVYEPNDLFAYFNLSYVSCNGLSDGYIDGTTIGGTPPFNYSWSSGDTTEDINNIPSDMYILSLTDNNNCFFTDTIVVFEPDELVANLIDSNGTLVSNASGGTTPYTYDIYNSAGIFATTSNNMGVSFIINPVLTGIYTLVVTDANGCVDSSQVTITASSIFDNNILEEIKLYPNPSRDIFNLSFFNSVKQDINISVYNLLGEKVYKELVKDHIGNFETSFNLELFGKSMYLLEIKSEKLIINKRLILK